MRTAARTARLAGEDLGEQRHICALVDGLDDADELMIPFVIDGFEQGDRAFHVVDPNARDEQDRKSTRLNSSHRPLSRMPSSA